jgi:peptidoglycan/xylan/chitin deacetylase (PgdA/CDA1 family)
MASAARRNIQMKNALFRAAGHVSGSVWNWLSDNACLLPYYHMVSDEPVPHVSPLYPFRSVAEFRSDLDCLLRGRRALSLGQFLSAVCVDGSPPRRSFLLTFDDGFREMHDIVTPILREKGVPAVFFIPTSTLDNADLCHHQKIALLLQKMDTMGARFPDGEVRRLLGTAAIPFPSTRAALSAVPWRSRSVLDGAAAACGVDFSAYLQCVQPHLTSDQIRAMLAQGMDIGAHSVDHPLYANIPLASQLQQTRASINLLAERFGLKHRAFAFPHGDWAVSREFFDTLFQEKTLDVSFGTSGPQRDSVALNFQRFSMEKLGLPAHAVLARHSIRGLKLRCLCQTQIHRAKSAASVRLEHLPA